jgi:hypothetical protein
MIVLPSLLRLWRNLAIYLTVMLKEVKHLLFLCVPKADSSPGGSE